MPPRKGLQWESLSWEHDIDMSEHMTSRCSASISMHMEAYCHCEEVQANAAGTYFFFWHDLLQARSIYRVLEN